MFSNRDEVHNDLSAPGEDILSTVPRALTEGRPLCVEQGYSPCGPREFRRGEGTSFAAPQVSAAAALLLSEEPSLTPDQVALILRRSATDMTPATNCKQCGFQRDDYSGWGRLDVSEAMRAAHAELPRADQFEPNDEAGDGAPKLGRRKPVLRLQATLDYWDDPIDVYRVWLRRGQRISARVNGHEVLESELRLWRPGTRALQRRSGLAGRPVRLGVGRAYRAQASGWHYVEVRAAVPGSGRYTLQIHR
jgi:hypothetical protein